MTDDLLDAVDSLSRPVHVRVVQPILRTKIQPNGRLAIDPEGNLIREVKGTQVIQVEHPPLLDQLEAAIRGEMNQSLGSAATPSFAQGVLNSDAMYLHARISSQVRGWCFEIGFVPSKLSVSNLLRAWYAARLAQPAREGSDDGKRAILRNWARMIEALLAPPRSREVIAPCPACGADTWTDSEGVVFRHPVKIEYTAGEPTDGLSESELAHANLATARAECRVCRAAWVGSSGIRALAWAIDHHEEIDEVSA